MRAMVRAVLAALAAALVAASVGAPAYATPLPDGQDIVKNAPWNQPGSHGNVSPRGELRVATYNASLNRAEPGDLVADLTSPNNAQAQAVAEVIQRTAPDIVLLNEFDYDEAHEAAELFRTNYLASGQRGQEGISYPYVYTAASNTGVPIGADLDDDGQVGGSADTYGFGDFPGQYGMVLYSKYPILQEQVRTFQNFLWKDMPDNLMPVDYYSPLVRHVFRLSSKSHWDVPVRVDGQTVHVIAAHPTPPTFDGDERRNARRNHDEIRLVSDYVTGGAAAEYIYDDAGKTGGLAQGERFVVTGDLNADPQRGESYAGAASQLLENPVLTDPWPTSEGAADRLGLRSPGTPRPDGGKGLSAAGTADFDGAGVLRVDYALPSKNLGVAGAGVFWPGRGEDGADLVSGPRVQSSDHRLVWVDVLLGE